MAAVSSGASSLPRSALRSRLGGSPFAAVAGVMLLAIALGIVVAATGLDALVLCVSLIVCGLVLFEFRIGVALVAVLMPISGSSLFPHAMLGLTGLNPLNLLLIGTLASLVLHRLYEGGVGLALPRPLWWLYLVPLLVAGAIGSRHVGEIVPGFYTNAMIAFYDTPGYL